MTEPLGKIIGILDNVNESILSVNFGKQFEIKRFKWEELVSYFKVHDIEDIFLPGKKDYVYAISYDIYDSKIQESFREFAIFEEVLHEKIRLLRLFKEGDVCMVTILNSIGDVVLPNSGESRICKNLYNIKENELPLLQKLLDFVPSSLKEYTELSLDNFELSYRIPDRFKRLQFLVIMTGIEVLLAPSPTELTHRISRNMAVLIGQNRDEASNIFKKMHDLYGIRSKIIHSGSLDPTEEQVVELRNYLRSALKAIILVNKKKDEVTNWLDSHGFGDGINLK